eukprot:scaffold172770_cov45-Attheya_sp.AAC.1
MGRLCPPPVERPVDALVPPPTGEESRELHREFWAARWQPWRASPAAAVAPSIGAIPVHPKYFSRPPSPSDLCHHPRAIPIDRKSSKVGKNPD